MLAKSFFILQTKNEEKNTWLGVKGDTSGNKSMNVGALGSQLYLGHEVQWGISLGWIDSTDDTGNPRALCSTKK